MAGKVELTWFEVSDEEWDKVKDLKLISIVDMVSEAADVSKSEARRLIKGGAVAIDDIRLRHDNIYVELNGQESVLQVGKRKFFRFT